MLRVDQTILGHDVRQEAEGSLHLRRRAVSTAENDDIRSQLFQELPRRRISPEKSWKKSWKILGNPWKILGNPWKSLGKIPRTGMSRESLGNVLEKSWNALESLGKILGKVLEFLEFLESLGKGLGKSWKSLENPWKIIGKVLEKSWKSLEFLDSKNHSKTRRCLRTPTSAS